MDFIIEKRWKEYSKAIVSLYIHSFGILDENVRYSPTHRQNKGMNFIANMRKDAFPAFKTSGEALKFQKTNFLIPNNYIF